PSPAMGRPSIHIAWCGNTPGKAGRFQSEEPRKPVYAVVAPWVPRSLPMKASVIAAMIVLAGTATVRAEDGVTMKLVTKGATQKMGGTYQPQRAALSDK